jgi:predicted PurR-regulated permease PerM
MEPHSEQGAQTVALRIIAGLMIVGAASMLAGLIVPFVLAIVLAIALSPVADRIEGRVGLGRSLGALSCTLAVAAALATSAVLVGYQTGTILQESDRYIDRFAGLLAGASRHLGGDRVMASFGVLEREDTTVDRPEVAAPPDREGGGTDRARAWSRFLHRNARVLGRWVVTGLGGLLGFLGGVVIFLAFLFYTLQTRGEWVDRITRAARRLGLRPTPDKLERVRREIVMFIGCLALVSLGYVLVVSLALWAIGVPQPLLWGVLAGLMEVVPYFGPMIAALLPTVVSLSLGHWWQTAATVALYVALHTIEGYVITPLLYGRAVKFDPVSILLGVMFFGWIWGPLGLAAAMPTMILLRGLLEISPDTPALDALVEGPAPGADSREVESSRT